MGVLEAEQKEIDLYKRYSKYYGYVFYLMQVRERRLSTKLTA